MKNNYNIIILCSIEYLFESLATGCRGYNSVAFTRTIKTPMPGRKVYLCRSFRSFNQDMFVKEVKDDQWSGVCMENDPEIALYTFMEKLTKLAEKQTLL